MESGWDEAVIEGFSGFLNGVEIGVILQIIPELCDEFVEFGFTDRAFGLAEDTAFGCPENAGFVFEDEGINENGVRLGIDNFASATDKLFCPFSDRGISFFFQLIFEFFYELIVGGGKCFMSSVMVFEFGTVFSFTVISGFPKFNQGVVFFDNGLFSFCEGNLGLSGGSGSFGNIIQFLHLQQFQDVLSFTDTSLGEK